MVTGRVEMLVGGVQGAFVWVSFSGGEVAVVEKAED
jgi:hypothetical protein